MRNLLALLAVLVLTFAGLGAWRGWYSLGPLPAESGKFAFRLEIDGGKVLTDVVQTARSLVSGLSEKERDREGGTTDGGKPAEATTKAGGEAAKAGQSPAPPADDRPYE